MTINFAYMNFRKQISLLLLILILGAYCSLLSAQNNKPKPTRQSSFEAFSNANYQKAYDEFTELLITYPKDPLYKYYSGVCLIKLNQNPEKAVDLLKQAIQGAALIKSLPSDAMFYLGRAQQLSGKFNDAAESYNIYTDQVGKRIAREMDVPEYIKQSIAKKGVAIEAVNKPVILNRQDSVPEEKPPVLPSVVEVQPQPQPVIIAVSEKEALPPDYEKILDSALNLQYKADSVNKIVVSLRKQLEKLPVESRGELLAKISGNELIADSLQKSADLKYLEAQVAMNPEHGVPQLKTEEVKPLTNLSVKEDTVRQPFVKPVPDQEKPAVPVQKVIEIPKKSVDVYSLFEILPKPVTDPKEKIEIDPDIPPGLIYRIQVAVFRNPVAPVYFKGITPVYGFKVPGSDRTNYCAGMFRRSADARKALTAVKAKGFTDAFVAAFSGGKTISTDRAALLEKEWGKKPFSGLVKQEVIAATPDTIPPTLIFRVELSKSVKPLKDEIVDGYKRTAGSKGLDIQNTDDGSFVYLIGKFITFESAEEFADLLIRNGYKDALVVAWLGNREVPVETARQLFDSLK